MGGRELFENQCRGPARLSSAATSLRLKRVAIERGVLPRLSAAFTSAPRATSKRTAGRLRPDASMSGVTPYRSPPLTLAPWSMRSLRMETSPPCAAI